ncbi:MAG: MBL fold metallo-hydrolase [Candidatus Niyogibacteria bacterium]|nr:MBL fold metallo-hydrolase [Candidatus Niyogibacteria bacterium]
MHHLRHHLSLYFLIALFSMAFLVWYISFELQADNNLLTVAFLDVGQGDAMLIDTPGDKQILIDGGSNKKVLSELGKMMPFYDRSIDVVIATHADADHIGGLPDVLARYDVEYIFDSDSSSDTGVFDAWQEAIQKENATYTHISRGTRIFLDENIWLDVIYPFKGQKTEDANDMSVVAKLIYGDTCFLLTGDLERTGEFKLLKDDLECDVLKVGHHGSKTSTSDAFLQAVSPAIAVISAGKENKYGHPHEVVMNKLQNAGISFLRTDDGGMIVLFSDGEKVWRE